MRTKRIKALKAQHDLKIRELEERNRKDNELLEAAIQFLCGKQITKIELRAIIKATDIAGCKLNHEH